MLELLFSDYRLYAQDAVAWTLCCAALIWGGGPERIVAASWLILFEIGTLVYNGLIGDVRRLETIDWYFAGIDILAGALWITVALYANRNYVLWIAAMQLLAIAAHLSRGLTEAIAPIAYAVMVVAPGWFQLLFLGAGLVRHLRRKRKFGPYRDWRVVRNPPFVIAWVSGLGAVSQWFRSDEPTVSWRDELK